MIEAPVDMDVTIAPITLEQVRQLRHLTLRAGRPFETTYWDGDEAPDTCHLGLRMAGRLVGIASLYLRPAPEREEKDAWQLRGMAVLPEHRGHGHGARLVEAAVAHVRSAGGRLVWCNARAHARRFYEHFGFNAKGERFDIPEIGPHFRMERRIDCGAE